MIMEKCRVASRLRELRGDIPRETVCKACGISVSALAMYEQGERIPRDNIKVKLAQFYGKSVEGIFFAPESTICAHI
jgi:putative transcriptional regulator